MGSAQGGKHDIGVKRKQFKAFNLNNRIKSQHTSKASQRSTTHRYKQI